MKGLIIFFLLAIQCLYGQVGVNNTDPQQALHIGYQNGLWPPIGWMRVESLNSTNNDFNGGDLNMDGNPANDLYPLYVDENGDFTLEFKPMLNTGEIDALDDTNLPTATVYLDPDDPNGSEGTDIVSYTITVGREAILEVKYSISFDVYFNAAKDKITDNLSRRVVTYLTVSGIERGYGPSSSNYSSGHVNSVAGTLHNFSTAFISLPSAGTYTLTLSGVVASDRKALVVAGPLSLSTYVEFATGHDFFFFRVH